MRRPSQKPDTQQKITGSVGSDCSNNQRYFVQTKQLYIQGQVEVNYDEIMMKMLEKNERGKTKFSILKSSLSQKLHSMCMYSP